MRLEFLLEEKSMAEVLNIILPKLIPNNIKWNLHPHSGKSDLKKSIPRKIKVFRHYPEIYVIIIQDKDSADCKILKQELIKLCEDNKANNYLIRIAVHELESWLLGDFDAIQKAFPESKVLKLANKAKFKNPDKLANASQELKGIIKNYQKVSGAKKIAPYLDITSKKNKSKSFCVFIKGISKIL